MVKVFWFSSVCVFFLLIFLFDKLYDLQKLSRQYSDKIQWSTKTCVHLNSKRLAQLNRRITNKFEISDISIVHLRKLP
jgi:hypothetical protein